MSPKFQNRIFFLDYLRGWMVLLVVLDHAMHAYSPHFKKFWYIPDFGGTLFFDLWHMHNDAIMMPMLFFLAGMFVLSSLKRRGFIDFCKEKFFRLILPFLIGIFIIVPPQTYTKYLLKNDGSIGFIDYFFNVYLFKNMSSSGFWFLYFLFVLTFILVGLFYAFPACIRALKSFASWLVKKPVRGFIVFFLIASVILGISDLIWGAPYWIGFSQIFYVRAARFIFKIFLFFLGAAIAEAGIPNNFSFLENLGNSWKVWVSVTLIAGIFYMTYTLMFYHEGAFNMEVPRYFYTGGTWESFGTVFRYYAPPILIRTTLLAFFICSLIVMYLAVFKQFLDRPIPLWQSLAACSFGIYIIHEPFVVWIHYYFYQSEVSEYFKFILSAGISLGISWWVISKIRTLPGFNKVL